MKQVLIYLIDYLKEKHGMSMSEISRSIGKSRNFIREAITRGYNSNDKYSKLIDDLRYDLLFPKDYTDFLGFLEKKHQEELHKTEIASDRLHKKLVSCVEKKNKTIADLEHRIVVLGRDIDKRSDEKAKLKKDITVKDMFIDGLENELKEMRIENKKLQDEIVNKEVLIEKYKIDLCLVVGLCLVLGFSIIW